MNNGDDPFNLPEHTIAGIGIDIVADERDVFAGKLNEVLGIGAGDAYLADTEELSPPYLTDTLGRRQHLWEWWKNAAASNPALADQVREALTDALGEGSAAAFAGDYSGNHQQPEVVVSADG